jgi:hypothetical protein
VAEPLPPSDSARGLMPYLEPRQRRALKEAERLLRERRPDLLWHHDLGTRVAALAEGTRYGRRRAEELARALGLSRVGVYQHMQFVARYPSRDEVVGLVRTRLRWAHIVALLPVDHRGDRDRLQRAAIRQRWSVDRLRLEVQGLHRARAGTVAWRRGEAAAAIERLDDATAAWLLAHELVGAVEEEGLLEQLWPALGREDGPALAARLQSLLEALDRLQGLAGALRDRLRALPGVRQED